MVKTHGDFVFMRDLSRLKVGPKVYLSSYERARKVSIGNAVRVAQSEHARLVGRPFFHSAI
jgi:hypothetical protein